ncbi:MAG: sulfur carrier protein ThiS [Psychrobium sp.]|nr:sulfur carrier protein ThiS [Psychrobium sp.]
MNNKPKNAVSINQQQWLSITPLKTTLNEILAQAQTLDKNVAVAVNNEVIPKTDWPNFMLKDNDQISVFGAIAGG